MSDVLAKPAPEIRWLVKDYIPMRTVTLFTGDGGAGKTMAALQLMAAVAAGKNWFGLPTMKGRCFGMFCEDEEAILHHRQLGISKVMQIADADLNEMMFMDRAGEDAVLFGPSPDDPREMDFTELFYRVCRILAAIRPSLIVIDTAADTFAGNENVRAQVRHFVRQLRQLSYDYDAAVVLCAHPSVAGISSGSGISGSTAWHNSVRSRLYLTKPEDDDADVRVLKAMKANYGPIAGEVRLRFDGGAFVRDERDTGMVANIKRTNVEKAVIAFIEDAALRGFLFSDSPRAEGRYLPRAMTRMHPDHSMQAIKAAMEVMLVRGDLEHKPRTAQDRGGLVVTRRHSVVTEDGEVIETPQ